MDSKVKKNQYKKVQTQGIQLIPLIIRFLYLFGILATVWFLGYFNFSILWVVIGLVLHVVRVQLFKAKTIKRSYAQQAVNDEKDAILARTDELPSWVYFPDIERAEWLNKMVKQMWPFMGEYVKQLVKEKIEPSVANSLPNSLKPFKFERIDLGDIPPRIGGIKVYTEHVKRDEMILDLEVNYTSDSDIRVAVRGLHAGIKDLQIHGTVRCVMKPLVNVIPIIGGMNVFFLNQPAVDFDLTNAANILDVPILSDTLRTVVQDQIAHFMVLPNKIPITLAKDVDLSRLKFPTPQGVLRIHIIAGRDLKAADFKVLGKGKSDPYCKIYIGSLTFKTKVINDTTSPVWNQYFEAIIDQRQGQYAEIECLDKDPGASDELGTASIDIQDVASKGDIDTWLPLENIETGMIHVRALWLHLSSEASQLEKTLSNQAKTKLALPDSTEEHLSSAIFLVHLDSAKGLPRSTKSMSEPSPFATLTVGNEVYKGTAKHKSTNPKWEENFQFLVSDPSNQFLDVKVLDSGKSDKKLGHLTVALKSLLDAPDLTVHQPYELKASTPTAHVVLRLSLRILTTEKPCDWIDDIQNEDTAKETLNDLNLEPETPPTTENKSSSIDPPVDRLKNSPSNNNDLKPIKTDNTQEPEMEVRKRLNASSVSQPSDDLSSNLEFDNNLGKIQLTIRYSQQRGKLIVVVHKAMNLLACDDNNLSDPYVRIYLLPERASSSKRKTQVVKDNLNPIYDETFEWSMALSDASGMSLEVSVKNQVGMFSKNRTLMGEAIINLDNLDITKPTTCWYVLDDNSKRANSSHPTDL